jgi:hydrogenase-4 component E
MTLSLLDGLLVVLLLLNLFMLGTSRIRAIIQTVALQGIVLGVLPLLAHEQVGYRVVLLALATVLIKAVVIPGMLRRAMRDLTIFRETAPLVSLTTSLLLGAAGTGVALVFGRQLPLAPQHTASLLVPTSLATVLTGFLILTTRTKAVTQALGYLVLENGIFIFGLLLIQAMPFLVEIGVLLDLFVGVFVMVIIINHIRQAFDSVSTERLAALKE